MLKIIFWQKIYGWIFNWKNANEIIKGKYPFPLSRSSRTKFCQFCRVLP